MNKWPFHKSFVGLTSLTGDQREVYEILQRRYDKFLDSNESQVVQLDIEANEASRQWTGQLITLATLLISISGLLLGQKDILNSLTTLQKWCLLLGVVSLIASVVSGVQSLRVTQRFFTNWASTLAKMPNHLPSTEDMDAPSELYKLKAKYLKEKNLIKDSGTQASDEKWDNLQLIAVVVGGLGYIALLSAMLFNIPLVR